VEHDWYRDLDKYVTIAPTEEEHMATTFPYLGGMQRLMNGSYDWDSTGLRIMLVGPGYTPDVTDTFVGSGAGSPGGEEISVDGYVGGQGGAGRKMTTGRTVTRRNNDKATVLDLDDVSFGVLGGGASEVDVAGGIIIRETGDDATSPLIVYVAFSQRQTDGTEFIVSIDADGLLWFVSSETEA
jgi:hypothetical protein